MIGFCDWKRANAAFVLTAATVVAVLLVMASLASTQQQGLTPLLPPNWPNVLGTDRLGRDVLAITIIGAARSLGWASLVLIGSATIGVACALVSASQWRGAADEFIEVLADSIRSFPSIVAALLFLAVKVPVPLVLVLYFWVPIWRVVRVQLGAQRMRPYVLNAMLFGRSRFGALAWHALPNATMGFRGVLFAVYAEIVSVQAGLEFLGFSTPLSQPTLGNIVAEAIRLGASYAWTWLPAAVLAGAITISLFVAGQRSGLRQHQRLE